VPLRRVAHVFKAIKNLGILRLGIRGVTEKLSFVISQSTGYGTNLVTDAGERISCTLPCWRVDSFNPHQYIFTPPTLFPPRPPLAVSPVIVIPRKHVFCFTPWREQIFRQREWNSNSRIFCSRLSIGLDLRSGTPDLSTFRAEKCTPERGKSTHVFCSCWHLLKKDEVTQAEDEWLCQLIVLCLDSMPREFLGFEIPLQTYLRLLSLVIIY